METKVDKSKVSMPTPPSVPTKNTPKLDRKRGHSLSDSQSFHKSPNKIPKLSGGLGGVHSDCDLSKLSEEEQLDRAMAQSLNETIEDLGVNTKSGFGTSNLDLLSEDDQLTMALGMYQ